MAATSRPPWRRGRRGPAIALALCCLAGWGCRPAPGDAPPLTVALPADISGVNELLSSSRIDHEIRSNLFLHLLAEQPDYQQHPPTFAPSLAASHELSADGLSLTFHLRPDAVWSDGAPITAEDVRWTWQAQTHPAVGWSYAFVKEAIEEVEVVDRHTARFRFRRPSPTQLLEANEGFVLPRHAWGQLPFEQWRERADWFLENLVTSGPYVLERWERQQEVVLARNPRYLDAPLPHLDRVVFRVIPDENARIEQLVTGRVDVVEGVPPGRVAELAARDGVEIDALWSRQYSYIVWNLRREPFDRAEVRRAMTLAIDREGLVEALWHGHARVGASPVLSTTWAHDRSLEPWPYDPVAARRLLDQAGWSDRDGDGVRERDGRPLTFELSTTTGSQLRRDALVLVQEQLRRVGVDARPAFYEPQALNAMNESGEFDATLSGWAVDTSLDVRYAFHSSEIEGGYNFGAYADPEADRLMEEIAATPEPLAARPAFARLQQVIHRDQPYTFLWEPQWLVARRSRVVEAHPSPLLTFGELERWRLAER